MSKARKDYKLYLLDILESCKRITVYTKGKSSKEFANDQKTIDAVVRNLEVIGEAAGKVPKDLRAETAEIPWHKIVGMRNKVIHEYFDVNFPGIFSRHIFL